MIDEDSGALTFSSAADYETPLDADKDNVYELSVVATDASGGVGTLLLMVTVMNVDDNMAVWSDGGKEDVSVNENGALVEYKSRASDADGDALTYSITGGADRALFMIDESTGELRFVIGTPNYEGGKTSYAVTIGATSGTGASEFTAPLELTVNVVDVDEAPDFSSGMTAISVMEGSNFAETYVASAKVAGQMVTYSLAGVDAAFFDLTADGMLSFKRTDQDFETPGSGDKDNVYEVTVKAHAGGESTDRNVKVTLTNVNEAPMFSSSLATTLMLDENKQIVGTYAASDPDADDAVLMYTLSGSDASKFQIDSMGALSYRDGSVPDYENPQDADKDRTYNVVITATDDEGLTDTHTLAVETQNVTRGSPTFSSGLLWRHQFSYDGNEKTYQSRSNVRMNENQYKIVDLVKDFGLSHPDSDEVSYSYRVEAGWSGSDLVEVRDNVIYVRSDTGHGVPNYESWSRTYDVRIQVSVPESKPTYLILKFSIDDVAEGGIFAADSKSAISVEENSNFSQTYVATPRVSGQSLTYMLSGVDAALFNLSADGMLSFKAIPDYETPLDVGKDNVYDVTIEAHAGWEKTDFAVMVTVTDNRNEGPDFATGSKAAISVNENANFSETYMATPKVPGSAVTFSLEGADAALFNIDSSTGALSFKAAPDYEKPSDDGKDNVYDVTVVATVSGGSSKHDVKVTVADVSEAPMFTSGASTTQVAEGSNFSLTYVATPTISGQAVTYGLEGVDAALFNLSADGMLSFKSVHDHENPLDDGKDNVYDVTVVAMAGGESAKRAVKVSVTNEPFDLFSVHNYGKTAGFDANTADEIIVDLGSSGWDSTSINQHVTLKVGSATYSGGSKITISYIKDDKLILYTSAGTLGEGAQVKLTLNKNLFKKSGVAEATDKVIDFTVGALEDQTNKPELSTTDQIIIVPGHYAEPSGALVGTGYKLVQGALVTFKGPVHQDVDFAKIETRYELYFTQAYTSSTGKKYTQGWNHDSSITTLYSSVHGNAVNVIFTQSLTKSDLQPISEARVRFTFQDGAVKNGAGPSGPLTTEWKTPDAIRAGASQDDGLDELGLSGLDDDDVGLVGLGDFDSGSF